MKGLSDLELIDLNSFEEKNINGGGFFIAVAAGLTIAAGTEIITDWDNFERGFTGQPYKE